MFKKTILSCISLIFLISLVIDGLIALGPVYPERESFFNGYMTPFYIVLALTVFGAPLLFHKDFLKKYMGPALFIPFIISAVYTYVYAFCGATNERRLGDYYSLSLALFMGTLLWISFRSRFLPLRLFQMGALGLLFTYSLLSPFLFLGYFLIYGTEMDSFGLLAIFQTNLNETIEYMEHIFPAPFTILPLLLITGAILLAFALAYHLMRKEIQNALRLSSASRWGKTAMIGLMIFFTLGLTAQIIRTYPLGLIHMILRYPYMLDAFRGAYQDRNAIMDRLELLPGTTPEDGTHIIVIGESACRDRMTAFEKDYPIDTTPWETTMTQNPNFIFAPKGYSNFPITVMALSYALTEKNQYNNVRLKDAPTLIDVARKAGYYTEWISYQARGNMWSAAISAIGEHADKTHWEDGYDGDVVKKLKQLPLKKKRILFIHINGSHVQYKDRVPETFDTGAYLPKNDPYYDYHRTLLYTDKILQDIYEYAKDHMNLQTMIYFSDHGEDMTYNHNTAPFYYDMVRIPFWIYLSPEYQKKHPALLPTLQANQNKIFTNDLIFDTASGLWGAKTNVYESLYDWSSPDYGLDDNALTLHGRLMIKDDPDKK